jgi:UDP-glucoronosyl and UDP-glucosyl transferase
VILSSGFEQFCTNLLADATLADRLLNLSYGRPDLALTDCFPYYRCAWILLFQLGIPYASTTAQYEPWLWRVPALPSFVPFPWAAGGLLTERMTFWQRVENIRTLVDWTAFPGVRIVEDRFVQDYLPDETYATLAARSVLWLIDTDTVVDYARPVMPNEVFLSFSSFFF